jgi:hypothetical protein
VLQLGTLVDVCQQIRITLLSQIKCQRNTPLHFSLQLSTKCIVKSRLLFDTPMHSLGFFGSTLYPFSQ